MDSWFFARAGQTQGPVSLEDLRRRLEAGEVRPSDLVWAPGLPGWQPAEAVSLLQTLTRGSTPSPGPLPGSMPTDPAPFASPVERATRPATTSTSVPSPAPAPPAVMPQTAAAAPPFVFQPQTAALPQGKQRAARKSNLRYVFVIGAVLGLLVVAGVAITKSPPIREGLNDAGEQLRKWAERTMQSPPTPEEVRATTPDAERRNGVGIIPPLNPRPGGTSRTATLYRCPLENLDAEAQSPITLGPFRRLKLTVSDPNPEKQWAYFYTCIYRHPVKGDVTHKVLTFEKYRGAAQASEYARTAAVQLKDQGGQLLQEEDLIAPDGTHLGHIFVIYKGQLADVIWYNDRHFLHIQSTSAELALEFKKQLSY